MSSFKSTKFFFTCLFLLSGISGIISAQSSEGEFIPKYPVKSAIIHYKLTVLKNWGKDTTRMSKPFFDLTFDDYGTHVRMERTDGDIEQLMGEPYVKIYRDNFVFALNDPKGCVTKRRIKDTYYMMDYNGEMGFTKSVQDMIHNKINKVTDHSFLSFNKTGTEIFMGVSCARYQLISYNAMISTKDKYIFLVYKDICLSVKNYLAGVQLISTVEATSFEENIPIPRATFEVPERYRMIDGDKLDGTYHQAASGFSTIIVNYKTQRDYYQTKGGGRKTLYSKEHGKKSVWEWEETISEYNLSPESRHYRKIRDEECEFLVDFVNKTVSRSDLVKSNYNYKTIAELNFLFENKLYDTTVKVLGKANFLGKDCTIFEIKTGIEKLEVHEWQGVFLKVKQYTCTDGPDCNQYILIGEETATNIQENVTISDSLFEYPEDFRRN